MKPENFISSASGKKIELCFISPHLDDAALSCGGLIEHLSENFKITVVSIFAGNPLPPYSLSGKMFLKQCKRENASELFIDRRSEDKKIFDALGVSVKHLDFADALWRKKKAPNFLEKFFGKIISEILHIYPTYRFHVTSGRISSLDQELISSINNELLEIIDKKNCLIFCPLGVGNHVDHVITRDCCLKISNDIILWSDFPYNKKNNSDFLNSINFKELIFYPDSKKKEKLIRSYESQFEAMFPHGNIEMAEERYYSANGNSNEV